MMRNEMTVIPEGTLLTVPIVKGEEIASVNGAALPEPIPPPLPIGRVPHAPSKRSPDSAIARNALSIRTKKLVRIEDFLRDKCTAPIGDAAGALAQKVTANALSMPNPRW
jgi:hypothetical protein